MQYVTKDQARMAARSASRKVLSSSQRILEDVAKSEAKSFDVFLSHSIQDEELVHGVYELLTAEGLRVYVDWIVDPQLDRSRVNSETAEKLRIRMRQCASLIYIHTDNATSSKWMPWELGYFDGFRSLVAVLPLVDNAGDSVKGQEYVDLYPKVDYTSASLWVNKEKSSDRNFGNRSKEFMRLQEWAVAR